MDSRTRILVLFDGDEAVLPLPPEAIEAASLSDDERQALVRATRALRVDLGHQLSGILSELGVPRDELTTMSLGAMRAEIKRREVPEEVQSARRQIARERAGLERPLPPRTPTERFEHLMAELGNTYESRVSRDLGEGRAAELRAAGDGWNSRSVAGGQCDPPAE